MAYKSKEQAREYARIWGRKNYQENKEAMAEKKRAWYQKNKEHINEQRRITGKKYREEHPEIVKGQRERYKLKNHDKLVEKRHQYYVKNREKQLQDSKDFSKKYLVKLRLDAFEHYGGAKCACCGETQYEFLCIDHINGGGTQHRKSLHTTIYGWLKKNNYPEGFQVLCHNCNMAKAYYGKCPHQT